MTDSLEDKLRKAYSEGTKKEERNRRKRQQYKEKKAREKLLKKNAEKNQDKIDERKKEIERKAEANYAKIKAKRAKEEGLQSKGEDIDLFQRLNEMTGKYSSHQTYESDSLSSVPRSPTRVTYNSNEVNKKKY